MTKTILITGGCGFISSTLVEHILRKTDWNIVIVDKLSYASKGLERLRDSGSLDSTRVRVFTTDLCKPIPEGVIQEIRNVHYIVHSAAETHVDNSIKDPVYCIENNVMSTTHILQYARQLKTLEVFLMLSTDEVYGNCPTGKSYRETDRHNPSNPYSASKSASEMICLSFQNTYKIPLITVNLMNAFGQRQHPEKFVPKCIQYILDEKELEIHTDTNNMPGSRFYIHARNASDAMLFILKKGIVGEVYNIPGQKEVDNLTMAQSIAEIMGKKLKYKLISDVASRPGHDLRYCLDGEKLEKLGWTPPVNFQEALKSTILWTLEHKKWLEE